MDKEQLELLKEMLSSLKDGDAKERLAKVITGYESGDTENADGDLGSELQSLMNEFESNYPDLIKAEADKDRFTNILNLGLNAFRGVSDIATGLKQERESEASLENLETPQGVRAFRRSDNLAEAISRAKRDMSPSSLAARTQALEADIEDQYQRDIRNAQVASTGQAGSFGSYAQLAAQNRIRNAMGAQEVRNRLYDQGNRNLNSLIGQEIAENQAADVNERARAAMDYQRYTDAAEAAGEAKAMGRLNRRTGFNELLEGLNKTLPEIINFAQEPNNPIKNVERQAFNIDANSLGDSLNPRNAYDVVTPMPNVEMMNFSTDSDMMDYNPFDYQTQFRTVV